MELSETLFHILLGIAIGYVVGRFHSYLREIKEEVHEVDTIVKKRAEEKGFMRFPVAADIAVIVTVALCLWASVSTQITNSNLKSTQGDLKATQSQLVDAQAAIKRITTCNQKYLTETVVALNERTGYAQKRADANVKVQRAQSKFWKFLLVLPPPSPDEGRAALEHYLVLIDEFVDASEAAKDNVEAQPYPTDQELAKCYDNADEQTKEDKNAAK